MAYLKISEARAAARIGLAPLQKSAGRVLTEEAQAAPVSKQYDIFVSHSYEDAELIYGVKKMIETLNLTVYVDWIDDAKLNRGAVTVKTAALLRERMKTCGSLLYAHSKNSGDSVWMPWELGYFNGLRGDHVWILPLVETSDSEYSKQEYLGLYPTVEKLSSLYGRQDLGFANVGDNKQQITLSEASRGSGIFLRS